MSSSFRDEPGMGGISVPVNLPRFPRFAMPAVSVSSRRAVVSDFGQCLVCAR